MNTVSELHQPFRPDARDIHVLIEDIARALVDDPDDVSVEALDRGESTTLRLHVSDRDVGKIIGKQGRTAHSLRTILSAVSMKYHHRYALDIVERSLVGDPITHPSPQSQAQQPHGN